MSTARLVAEVAILVGVAVIAIMFPGYIRDLRREQRLRAQYIRVQRRLAQRRQRRNGH